MWLICEVNVTTLLCCCCESECECAALQQQHNGLDYCLSMAFVKPLSDPHTSEKALASIFCRFEQLLLNNALWRWAVLLLLSLLATSIRAGESRCLTASVAVAGAFSSARSEKRKHYRPLSLWRLWRSQTAWTSKQLGRPKLKRSLERSL